MTGLIGGAVIGFVAKGWAPLILATASCAALISWWRIFFAIRRLTGDGSGPQLIVDARNIALTSGVADEQELARKILDTRVLPPITFGNYLAAFWFEIVPMLVLASVVFAVKRYLF